MTLDDLKSANGFAELSLLLGVSIAELSKGIYGHAQYSSFEIPKKSGGTRTIESPRGVVRQLQESLAPLLIQAYRPSQNAHGFISGRSVLSNARPHVAARSLINVDLLEFFHSISFYRVRGLFLADPFGFKWEVANILASACCFNGRLPAGGITSPVLSNLVLHRLDKKLTSLCVRAGGRYTRYADDLSLSFPKSISRLGAFVKFGATGFAPGPELVRVITEEGFEINEAKFRVSTGNARKVAAGLVVNQKVNVQRRWFKKLEAEVYSLNKFGPLAVASHTDPAADPEILARKLLRRTHGKLAYLYMIRGAGDWVTSALASKFNAVSSNPLLIPDVELVSRIDRVPRATLVVTCNKKMPADAAAWDEQGTGYVTASGLIMTAAHVLLDESTKKPYPYVYVRSGQQPGQLHACSIVALDEHRDLALVKLQIHDASLVRIRLRNAPALQADEDVHIFGFPQYSYGHPCAKQSHSVTLVRVTSGVKKGVVDGNIQGGISGGPVVNERMEVVGMVHRGLANGGHANEIIAVEEFGHVPLT